MVPKLYSLKFYFFLDMLPVPFSVPISYRVLLLGSAKIQF